MQRHHARRPGRTPSSRCAPPGRAGRRRGSGRPASSPPCRTPPPTGSPAPPSAGRCRAPPPATSPRPLTMLRNHSWPDRQRQAVHAAGTLTRSSRRSRSRVAATAAPGRSRSPARPRASTASTARPPSAWLTAVPRAMPAKPSAGSGPQPQKNSHASGTLTTATPPQHPQPGARVAGPDQAGDARRLDHLEDAAARTAAAGTPTANSAAVAVQLQQAAPGPADRPGRPALPSQAEQRRPAGSTGWWRGRRRRRSPAPTKRATRAVLPTLTRTV